jgi:hypothetical protein
MGYRLRTGEYLLVARVDLFSSHIHQVQEGSEPTVDHYLFKAFENSPWQRDTLLNQSHVYMLKASSIFIENQM